MYYQRLSILLLLISVIPLVASGPVLSPCSSSNSYDPCCNLLSPTGYTAYVDFDYSWTMNFLSDCYFYPDNCTSTCGGIFAQAFISSAALEQHSLYLARNLTEFNCWNGYTNFGAYTINAAQFLSQLNASHCSADFSINGGWSEFGPYGECICDGRSDGMSSYHLSSSTCTNPVPFNGGKPCSTHDNYYPTSGYPYSSSNAVITQFENCVGGPLCYSSNKAYNISVSFIPVICILLVSCILFFSPFIEAGPVLSPCNSNSTDPCCGIGTTFPDNVDFDGMLVGLSVCASLRDDGDACVTCGGDSYTQGYVNYFGGLFAKDNCWGGYISQTNPNGSPMYLDINSFLNQLPVADCTVGFTINGGWTGFSPYSSCSGLCEAFGNITRSRSCTSPTPRNNGSECVGDTVESILCYHSCTNTTITVTQVINDAINSGSRIMLPGLVSFLVIMLNLWLVFVE